MTTAPQPGEHLDAEQIGAFAEDALPAAERALCLAHLAECALCREIAFLAGATVPSQQTAPRFHFAWWPALPLGAAALAAAVMTVVLVHRTPTSPVAPRVDIATAPAPPHIPPAPLPPPAEPPALQKPIRAALPAPRSQQTPVMTVPAPLPKAATPTNAFTLRAPAAAPSFGGPVTVTKSTASAGMAAPPAPPQAFTQADSAAGNITMAMKRAASAGEITGFITDTAGATISNASVVLDATAGAAHRQASTDRSGRFTLNGLPPGQYRMEISAPGFATLVRNVDLGSAQVAHLDSQLAPGALTETVAVTSDSATVSASTADLTAPMQNTVQRGDETLALNTAGKVLFRKSSAKHFKPVRGPWKKDRVTAISLTPANLFQVQTATGVWTSADGRHWAAATQP